MCSDKCRQDNYTRPRGFLVGHLGKIVLREETIVDNDNTDDEIDAYLVAMTTANHRDDILCDDDPCNNYGTDC